VTTHAQAHQVFNINSNITNRQILTDRQGLTIIFNI